MTNTIIVVICALVACISAGHVRGTRGYLTGLPSSIGISSGYGGAYGTYGDYSGYNSYSSQSAPPIGYSTRTSSYYVPDIGYYTPVRNAPRIVPDKVVNEQVVEVPQGLVEVPQVVNVPTVAPVPPVVTTNNVVAATSARRSYSGGYTGYGSGIRSGYFGFSDYSSYPGYSRYPGYSGYASAWW